MLQVADDLMIDVQLKSAPGASAYAGVGYLHALGVAAGQEILIDCHDDAGLVMAALRTGCCRLVFNGPREIHQRLADMADQFDATLNHAADDRSVCLSLSPDDDRETIRQLLAGFSQAKQPQ